MMATAWLLMAMVFWAAETLVPLSVKFSQERFSLLGMSEKSLVSF